MDEYQLKVLEARLLSESRQASHGTIVWICSGMFGGHRFFFGKHKTGAIQALLMFIGIATSFTSFGVPIILAVMTWATVDIFLISRWAQKDRESARQRILAQMQTQIGAQEA